MKINQIMTGIMAAVMITVPVMGVYASDGEEYITISVQASDDNEGITYAIDNDDPGSFGPSNTFTIPADSASHTIYVKDAAGNITSQVYEPPVVDEPETATSIAGDYDIDGISGSTDSTDYTDTDSSSSDYDDGYTDNVNVSGEYDGRTIDIDLELGKSKDENEKSYEIKRDTPAEQGEGTVYSKTFLDGTDNSEQVFYSLTTEEGNVFYLLIDQGQENNNVYLLNQVSNQELSALAVDSDSTSQPPQSSGDDSLLKALSGSGNEENSADSNRTASKGGINSNAIILLLVMAAGGGFYYYQKVYKTKKEQEMDAMEAADMDQFVGENVNEEDEFDFEYGDDDKEQYIRDLIREDEEEYAAAAESESMDMGWDNNDIEELNEDGSKDDIFSDDGDMPVDDIFSDDGDMFVDDIFSDTSDSDEYDPDPDGEE